MTPKQRIARLQRGKKRGAALVEAALVIPVMLVFLGTTMFAHKSYEEKIAQQASARAEILYYGSHNCAENAPSEMSNQLGAVGSTGTSQETGDADPNGGQGAGELGGTSNKLRDSEKQGVSRSWQVAKTHRSQVVNGKAVQEQKTVGLARLVVADAEVACNEKRFDNDWTAIFGFIKSFAQSGGGFIN